MNGGWVREVAGWGCVRGEEEGRGRGGGGAGGGEKRELEQMKPMTTRDAS